MFTVIKYSSDVKEGKPGLYVEEDNVKKNPEHDIIHFFVYFLKIIFPPYLLNI